MIMVVDLTASKVLEGRLRRRFAQQTVLREIGEALQSAVELDETLRRVLVGATAGQGLRFNRAFLLLVDEAAGELRGRLAIGPADPEEAHRIWSALARTNPSLKNLLHRYQPVVESDSARVNQIVLHLSAPLTDPDGFLVRCLRGRRTVRVVEGVEAGSRCRWRTPCSSSWRCAPSWPCPCARRRARWVCSWPTTPSLTAHR